MGMTYAKIRKDLRKQKEIEGNTADTALLLKLVALKIPKSSMDWQVLTELEELHYGTMSYETHRFWYPSDVLRGLESFFTQDSSPFERE